MNELNKPEFRFSHIGINSENSEEARNASMLLATLFGLDANEGEASIFVNKEIEVIKSMGAGKCGHVAFYTPNIKVAMAYLEQRGITFNMDSIKYNEQNEIAIIYLNQEVNGFAIHLTNKGNK